MAAYGPNLVLACFRKACFFIFFLKSLFIYSLERERERAGTSWSLEPEQGLGERKEEKQTPCGSGNLMGDSILGPWDHDLSKRQTLMTESPKRPMAFYTFKGLLTHTHMH